MELIRRHQKLGDEIFIIHCKGELKDTFYNSCKGLFRCHLCISKFNHAMKILNINPKNIFTINLSPSKQTKDISFQNIKQLKSHTYKGVDVGMSTASDLISLQRDPSPNVQKIQRQLDRALKINCALVDQLPSIIKSISPDTVYMFNGRFSIYRTLMRICQQLKINCYIHERAGKPDRYSLTFNTSPHDFNYTKAEIKELWEKGDSKKETIAKKWFKDRAKGSAQAWYSFTSDQRKTLNHLNINQKIISIFISSEDEFEAISGWENPYFTNQNSGIDWLLNHFKEKSNILIVIRVHPNLANLKNSQTTYLNRLSGKNLLVVKANEKIDSYDLLKKSSLCITFGSTIGVEAVYWGIPSLLLGRAFYEDYPSILKPANLDELPTLLDTQISNSTQELNTSNVLSFGYWQETYGHKFKHFKVENLSNGLFEGNRIQGNKIILLLSGFMTLSLEIKAIFQGKTSLKFLLQKVKNKLPF